MRNAVTPSDNIISDNSKVFDSDDTITADIFVSLGPACREAHYLRDENLRLASFPLDWMLDYSLETVIHLLKTGFNDFFTDIEEGEYRRKNSNYCIIDTKNHITSLHHFSRKMSIPDAKKAFHTTMQKRYKRLDSYLRQAETICFICNRIYDDSCSDELVNFLKEFDKIYPNKTVTLVNINKKDIPDIKIAKRQVAPNLLIKEYTFKDIHTNGDNPETNYERWRGNEAIWRLLVKKMKLTEKFKSAKRTFNFFKITDYFSVRNEYQGTVKHKVWNILGLKIKYKSKRK